MTRLAILCVLCILLAAIPDNVLAVNTWCYTSHPGAVYCEDFDRYCSNPPPAPGRCEPQGNEIRDQWAMWDVWNPFHTCGWMISVHDEFYASYPYSAKIGCQPWKNELGYSNTGITSGIRNKFGNMYTDVLATDLTPLIFEFGIHGGVKLHYANMFIELGRGLRLDGKEGLTSYVPGPDCALCGSTQEHTIYPRICRTSTTPSGCAAVSTAPVIPTVAAGFLAFLDPDPCHCGETENWPRTDHLAFFDGRQWWTLPAGFPDPGGSEPATGDFSISGADVYHNIKLLLTSTSVTVEMRAAGVLSRCAVPRAYTGPFNSMGMGYQVPCQLTPGTWECNGAPDCNGQCGPDMGCCVSGTNWGGTVPVDNLVLEGGQGYAEPGACCFPDTTCTVTYQGDCPLLGGQPGPAGSTCETHACCPRLLPDHDLDGDVDLADFGWFQTCLAGPEAPPPSVPCQCADFQGDGFVDNLDLSSFLGCLLGPEIPADPGCMP